MGAAGILVVIILMAGGIYGMSVSAISKQHMTETHPYDASIGNVVEGARLGDMFGCTECHGTDLGGTLLIDGMPFARVPAPNLTSGAPGGGMTDEQFEQALRHGIGRDGRKL